MNHNRARFDCVSEWNVGLNGLTAMCCVIVCVCFLTAGTRFIGSMAKGKPQVRGCGV